MREIIMNNKIDKKEEKKSLKEQIYDILTNGKNEQQIETALEQWAIELAEELGYENCDECDRIDPITRLNIITRLTTRR